MERGKKMAVEVSSDKPEYEIYIPSMTKEKIPIPQEKLDAVIAYITKKAMEGNGGCNMITHVQGYWKGEDGEKVVEANKIIRIVGENPLTDEDMEKIGDYLEQKCIALKKTPNCEMHSHSVKPKETHRYFRQRSLDGSELQWYCESYDDNEIVIAIHRVGNSHPCWTLDGTPITPAAKEIN